MEVALQARKESKNLQDAGDEIQERSAARAKKKFAAAKEHEDRTAALEKERQNYVSQLRVRRAGTTQWGSLWDAGRVCQVGAQPQAGGGVASKKKAGQKTMKQKRVAKAGAKRHEKHVLADQEAARQLRMEKAAQASAAAEQMAQEPVTSEDDELERTADGAGGARQNIEHVWTLQDTVSALEAVLCKQLEDRELHTFARRVTHSARLVDEAELRALIAGLEQPAAAQAALRRAADAHACSAPFWRERWVAGLSGEEADCLVQFVERVLPESAGGVTLRDEDGAVSSGVRADRARYAVDPVAAYPLLSTALDTHAALLGGLKPRKRAQRPVVRDNVEGNASGDEAADDSDSADMAQEEEVAAETAPCTAAEV